MGGIEIEALIPKGTPIKSILSSKAGFISKLKGYEYYTKVWGHKIPIREFGVNLGTSMKVSSKTWKSINRYITSNASYYGGYQNISLINLSSLGVISYPLSKLSSKISSPVSYKSSYKSYSSAKSSLMESYDFSFGSLASYSKISSKRSSKAYSSLNSSIKSSLSSLGSSMKSSMISSIISKKAKTYYPTESFIKKPLPLWLWDLYPKKKKLPDFFKEPLPLKYHEREHDVLKLEDVFTGSSDAIKPVKLPKLKLNLKL